MNRTNLSTLIVAALIGVCAAIPARSQLTNAGFETGTFAGWGLFGQGWRISSWPGDQYDGTYGAVNDVMPSDVDDWRGITQLLPATPNVTYVLDAYIRAVNVNNSSSFLEMQFLDSGNNVIAQYQSSWVNADQPFTYTSVTGVAPANAVAVSARGIVYMRTRPTSTEFHIFDTFSIVPEPSTAAMAAVGIGALLAGALRRRFTRT